MTRLQAWKTAVRTHTLPAAVVPVLVGGGLASGSGAFRLDAFLWALSGAVAIQIAANFANDVSDARRGVDTGGRIGPPRMVAQGVISPTAMWRAVALALAVAAAAGVALTVIAGPVILIVGAASVLAMLGYVGGPRPYGYHGLGEPAVFLFFGVVATTVSRFVHDGTVPAAAWLLAIPVGMLVTAILVANNYRDIDTDGETGKRTLAVILGRERTRLLYALLVYGTYPVIVALALSGAIPRATLFAGLLAPAAVPAVRSLWRGTDGPSLIRVLVSTSRLHLWTGVVLAAASAL